MKLARLTSLTALACVSALSAACSAGGDDDMISPRGEVIDRTTSAITADGLWYINGTYSTCKGHVDGTSWSLAIGANTPRGDTLKVAKGDTACALSLTSVEQTDEAEPPVTTIYEAASSIALTAAWKEVGTAFTTANALAFYGNAMLSSVTYGGDFTLSILVSDSSFEDKTRGSSFASFAVSADPQTVSASNYAGTMSLTLGVDFEDKVTDQSGTFDLTAPESGALRGDGYVVSKGPFSSPPTFAEIDAEYRDGADVDETLTSRVAIGPAEDPAIPASGFGLMTVDLTANAYRWIIVHREENGISSYQVIRVTFTPPPAP